jgi:hypothetical protein
VKELGRFVIAVALMLASASFSEELVQPVATQVTSGRVPVIVADTMTRMPMGAPVARELPPRVPEQRVPEQLVMLVVGGVLIRLGGAGRTRRPDR